MMIRSCKEKICQKCGKEYQPTGINQKFCSECKPTAAERTKQWRIKYPEQAKEASAAWNLIHPEQVKEYQKVYHFVYEPLHRHEAVLRVQRWQKKNPEKVREIDQKHRAKRRELGFIPLNDWFNGCEGHHLDKERVIHIPQELHQSVSHNVWTGKNMEQINKLALAYLGGN